MSSPSLDDPLDRVRAILDAQEGRGPVALANDEAIRRLLATTHRIAIVGASSKPHRPSHGVMADLLAAGYQCVPVNPNETEVLGQRAYPTLAAAVAAVGPVEIVDVFRRPEETVPIAREAVAVGARCLWLQLGVVNWEAARLAASGGLLVVMDRCLAVEERRLAGGHRP
jgi:predicted CoA-binding protein